MATYIHAVCFRCKSETAATEIDALTRDAAQLLTKIPTVTQIFCGRRDPGAQRDVNDTRFHVGLVAHFSDRSGYEAYLEHALHFEFVRKHREHWGDVTACDFVAA